MTATLLLVFAAVFLGTFSLAFSIQRALHSRRIRHRIRKFGGDTGGAGGAAAIQLLRKPGPVERVLSCLPVTASVSRLIQQSGVDLSTLAFLLLAAALSGSALSPATPGVGAGS